MSAQYEDMKNKLVEMRDELSERLSKIQDDRRHVDGPLDADSGERAVEMENDDVLDALDNAGTKELKAINIALERINNGEYDSCSQCGETIAPQRLEAIPYTALCVNCASKLEQ